MEQKTNASEITKPESELFTECDTYLKSLGFVNIESEGKPTGYYQFTSNHGAFSVTISHVNSSEVYIGSTFYYPAYVGNSEERQHIIQGIVVSNKEEMKFCIEKSGKWIQMQMKLREG